MIENASGLVAWDGVVFEPAESIRGRHAVLERFRSADHAAAIHAHNRADPEMWRYLPYGPFPGVQTYESWGFQAEASRDPCFYAIGHGGDWLGTGAAMRVDRANGVGEIGHLAFSPALQRSAVATEALHLLMDQFFEAGFRRVEWKCDAANAPSRRAAARLGFAYEGVFRQHMVVKGANRDTAWFAILDHEWPAIRTAHRAWLDPGNFDADGCQKTSLSDLVAAARRSIPRPAGSSDVSDRTRSG